MPRRTRACVGWARRSPPPNFLFPLAALSKPITAFISVVLPAPLRPMRPIIACSGTASVTPRRICTALMATLRLRTSSMRGLGAAHHMAAPLGIGERHLGTCVGDDAPVVEREHPLGVAADHFHVVLDEEHGSPF